MNQDDQEILVEVKSEKVPNIEEDNDAAQLIKEQQIAR